VKMLAGHVTDASTVMTHNCLPQKRHVDTVPTYYADIPRTWFFWT